MGAALLVAWSILTACNRDETRVYHVDQEAAPPSAPPAAPAAPSPPAADAPSIAATPPDAQLHYQTPPGWRATPLGELRVASFTVAGPDRQTADISVIPLPVVGRDLALINLWRSQVKLPETSDPAAIRQADPVAIGADEGRLFRFVSQEPMLGKSRQQILVAMLTRGGTSWFFRIVGPVELVDAQKNRFLQFLKSVSFTDNTPPATAPNPPPAADQPSAPDQPAPAPAAASSLAWTVPSGWQPTPPAPFLVAEYTLAGEGDARATVNVAKLKGQGGGLLANANRWRGQIGLDPLGEDVLSRQVQVLDLPEGEAMLVDFTGPAKNGASTRLVGAMVERDGQSWFYKLMGDSRLVARQKAAFVTFIRSAHDANAR